MLSWFSTRFWTQANGLLTFSSTSLALFIAPVGRNARFGDLVHFLGADLDFDALAVRSDDGGVEGLVHVGFGRADVVFEFVSDGLPEGMHDAQGFIALGNGIQNDAKGDNVVDIIKGQVLAEAFSDKCCSNFYSDPRTSQVRLFSSIFVLDDSL